MQRISTGDALSITGVSFDCWDTLLQSAMARSEVHAKRIDVVAEFTGSPREAIAAALLLRNPGEASDCGEDSLGLSVEARTHLLLECLGRNDLSAGSLAERLSEAALAHMPMPLHGVREALYAVAEQVPVAVISNTRWTSGRVLRAIMTHPEVGLGNAISSYAFSDEHGVAKPSTRLFHAAWEGHGVAPAHTVHVGDSSRRDLRGARAVGARAILSRVGCPREPGDTQADALCFDYAALPALLHCLEHGTVPPGWTLCGEWLPVWGRLVGARAFVSPKPGQPVPPGTIIVLKNSSPDFEPFFHTAAGIVAAAGGYGSHAAQTAPQCDTPCIVGAEGILDEISTGDLLIIDGSSGTVLRQAAGD